MRLLGNKRTFFMAILTNSDAQIIRSELKISHKLLEKLTGISANRLYSLINEKGTSRYKEEEALKVLIVFGIYTYFGKVSIELLDWRPDCKCLIDGRRYNIELKQVQFLYPDHYNDMKLSMKPDCNLLLVYEAFERKFHGFDKSDGRIDPHLLRKIASYLDMHKVTYERVSNSAVDFITDGVGATSIRSITVSPVKYNNLDILKAEIDGEGNLVIVGNYWDFEIGTNVKTTIETLSFSNLTSFLKSLKYYQNKYLKKYRLNGKLLTKTEIIHKIGKYITDHALYQEGKVKLDDELRSWLKLTASELDVNELYHELKMVLGSEASKKSR